MGLLGRSAISLSSLSIGGTNGSSRVGSFSGGLL